jgi:uncharacterized Zn ribbon protein
METRDSNGTLLADGDNVTLIKDLKVKGKRCRDPVLLMPA